MAQDAPVQTIADIARLAGVSKSTVSRALNDSPLIGAETKERIREIAQLHHFQMNDPARRLSLKQSNVVALVTYEYKTSLAVPDAFMLEIMSGITAGLHANGYDLLVIQVSPNDTDWVRAYLESGRVDGFILMATSCTQRHIATLAERKAPFIIWGLPPGAHGYSTVGGTASRAARPRPSTCCARAATGSPSSEAWPARARCRTGSGATRLRSAKPGRPSTRRSSPTATSPSGRARRP